MPKNVVPGPGFNHATTASLMAVLACAFASEALASRPQAEPVASKQELSARVGAITERARQSDPALQRKLPPALELAQWRNYR